MAHDNDDTTLNWYQRQQWQADERGGKPGALGSHHKVVRFAAVVHQILQLDVVHLLELVEERLQAPYERKRTDVRSPSRSNTRELPKADAAFVVNGGECTWL